MAHRRTCAIAVMSVVGLLVAEGVARAQCAVVNPAVAPAITLTSPEFYFRDNGTQSLLLGRNPTGWDTDGSAATNTQHFDELFGYATGIERIVRIQIVTGARPNPAMAGDVDCNWVVFWDDVFTRAEQNGLHVLPVFGVHAQWRAALPNWANNEYNSAYGTTCLDGTTNCLTTDPGDLLRATATRDAWIAWVRTLVARWKDRSNIIGWEIFSEVDLVDGATEADAESFIEAARSEIRAEDPNRPVTASTSGTIDWAGVHGSSIDFIEVHPYSSTFGPGNLDEMILTFVRQRRLDYPGKPLMIGESGLHYLSPDDAGNPYTLAEPGARTAINQAIWAGAVSGAMNARSLWWEDGYDRFHIDDLCATDAMGVPLYPQYAAYAECIDGNATTKLTLRALYADAAAPVAAFVQGVDYAGFAPVGLTGGPNLYGAALGGSNVVLGWVKDVNSVAASNWTASAALSGETVTLDLPGTWTDWQVDFYDTTTGALIPNASLYVQQDGAGDITFTLPDFNGSIAFKVSGLGALQATIDVIPASPLNRINMTQPLPVYVPITIARTADVDPDAIDTTSIAFGPASAVAQFPVLVDSDGDMVNDFLRVRFIKADTGYTCKGQNQIGELKGKLLNGRSFTGTNLVWIVGATLPPC